MGTILIALKSVSSYPIPSATVEAIGLRRGLTLNEEATERNMLSTHYRLAEADLKLWLSRAPQVSEGGSSFSFSEAERRVLRQEANGVYKEIGEKSTSIYGYKGDRL